MKEEESEIREELRNMSFEELQELKARLGSKLFSEATTASHVKLGRPSTLASSSLPRGAPQSSFKRANKNRPREESPRRPPAPVRDVVHVPSKLRCDPRFDDHFGEYKPHLWKKSYSFIEEMKEKELEEVRKEMRSEEEPDRKKKLKDLLQRMQNQRRAKEQQEASEARLRKAKKESIKAIREGRKPFFKKRSELKEEELQERFHQLKSSGKLKKYMDKKRRRIGGAERKAMPNR